MADDTTSTEDTTTPPEQGTEQPKPPAGEGKAPTFDGDFDPERAKRALAAARAGEEKSKQTVQALKAERQALLKALGLGEDGKEDPEAKLKELAEAKAAAEARATEYAIRDAVRTAAPDKTVSDLLLDSTSFSKKLAKLDAAADDFGDKVAALVKAEVKDNPRYQTKPVIAGRGTDHTGGGGTTRPQGLGAAIAARMNS